MNYKEGNLFAAEFDMERVWNTPSGQVLKQIDKILKESEIATIVREAYGVGKSGRGNRCYDLMILLRM